MDKTKPNPSCHECGGHGMNIRPHPTEQLMNVPCNHCWPVHVDKMGAKTNKYRRFIEVGHDGQSDVYDVLVAFEVTCPATQHAIKKLLCAGLRGGKTALQDLQETAQAVQRAIELEEQRLKGGS